MFPRASRLTARLRGMTVASAVSTLIACQPPPPAAGSGPSFRASVSGVDWELVELDGKTASTGAGGRRATMRFDTDSARVSGFGGCNRYSGTYTLEGDWLAFGPLVMTRMACTEGMQLETGLSAALVATTRYELSSTQLKLFGPSGAVARFSRQIPNAANRSPDT